MSTEKSCVRCHRPMRPRGVLAAQHPGTVGESARGYCFSCWAVARPERERAERPSVCVDCARPMRPRHSLASDHPGTLAHKARGLCAACWKRSYPADEVARAARNPVVGEPDPDVLAGLTAYYRGRRERAARAARRAAAREAVTRRAVR